MKIFNRTNKELKLRGILQSRGSGDYDTTEMILKPKGEIAIPEGLYFDFIEILEDGQ